MNWKTYFGITWSKRITKKYEQVCAYQVHLPLIVPLSVKMWTNSKLPIVGYKMIFFWGCQIWNSNVWEKKIVEFSLVTPRLDAERVVCQVKGFWRIPPNYVSSLPRTHRNYNTHHTHYIHPAHETLLVQTPTLPLLLSLLTYCFFTCPPRTPYSRIS